MFSGLVTAMIVESLKITPYAMLSRPAAGIRKGSLIVNLPGSEKGVRETIAVILPALPHALKLMHSNLPTKPSEHMHPSSAS